MELSVGKVLSVHRRKGVANAAKGAVEIPTFASYATAPRPQGEQLQKGADPLADLGSSR